MVDFMLYVLTDYRAILRADGGWRMGGFCLQRRCSR